MKKGIQQIMLGTVTGKPEQTLQTLQKIKKAGYDGIELNRFMIHPSSLFVRLLTRVAGMPTGKGGNLNWAELIRESGLEVISLHSDLGSLEKEMENVIQEAKQLATDTVVITGMYRFDYREEKNVTDLAERLNRAGEKLNQSGLTLLYHNHNAELVRVTPEMCAYEMLLKNTDPERVGFEFDSYWFTDAGADAGEWMKKLGSRMKLWHATDRGIRAEKSMMTPILKADSMELGTGNMNLKKLLSLARQNDVKAVVLESHRNWVDHDPLKSMEMSAEWMKESGIE